MAKVLLTWELGGGLGHCVKIAPLARSLVASGHDVYFSARDVVTAKKVLQNPAVKYLQSPCFFSKPLHPIRQPRSLSHVLSQTGLGDDEALCSLLDSWRSLFDLIRPRLIVCEHSPCALLASRLTDAFRVIIGTGFSLPPDISPLPDLCPWMEPLTRNLPVFERDLLDRVNRWLTANDLAPLNRLAQVYADAHDSFLMTFPELDHHREREPAVYWGSWAPSGGINPEWPEGDGPRVFAYLKSPGGPFQLEAAIAAVRELPARTLAYIPRPSKSALALCSKSLRICSEPLNIAATLERCDVALTNGTAGTTTQCLLAGVPVLMIPFYLEQIVFGRRVAELGAGMMTEPNHIELFAARLARVLQEDGYRRGARAFAERYTDYDPIATQTQIANRIQALLEESSTQPRLKTITGHLLFRQLSST